MPSGYKLYSLHTAGNNGYLYIILFISYIIVQQQDVVSKKHQKYKTWCGLQFNYMVVKYMTMSLASHWFIVLQVIVLSRIINLRRSRDCLCESVAAGGRRPAGRLRLFVCVIALLHLLILGKCYAVHINASSL